MEKGTIDWINNVEAELLLDACHRVRELKEHASAVDMHLKGMGPALTAEYACREWAHLVALVECYPTHEAAAKAIEEHYAMPIDEELFDPFSFLHAEAARESIVPQIRELIARLRNVRDVE